MFTEESFENVVIEYLKEQNYDYIHGSNLTRDNKEILLLKNFETNDVFTNNKLFHKYLTEGIEITDFINGKTVYHTVKLIDFNNIKTTNF